MFITVPNICEWVLLLFRWYNIRRRIHKKVLLRCFFSEVMYTIYGTMYSRMHEVKLWKTAFKYLKGYGLLQADHTLQVFSKLKKTILFQISYLFKGCLPQILLGLFLNTLPKIYHKIRSTNLSITRLRKMFCLLFTSKGLYGDVSKHIQFYVLFM